VYAGGALGALYRKGRMVSSSLAFVLSHKHICAKLKASRECQKRAKTLSRVGFRIQCTGSWPYCFAAAGVLLCSHLAIRSIG
jgi:hypothetical protein